MSSEHNCIVEKLSEIFEKDNHLDQNQQELNTSASLQQKNTAGDKNANSDILNNVDSLFIMNNSTIQHQNSSLNCMKENVVTENSHELDMHSIISQNKNSNVYSLRIPSTDTEEMTSNDDSQSNLSTCNDMTNFITDIKQKFNHCDDQKQFITIPVLNNKIQSNNKKINENSESGQQTNKGNFTVYQEVSLEIDEKSNFKTSVNFDLLDHYEKSTSKFDNLPASTKFIDRHKASVITENGEIEESMLEGCQENNNSSPHQNVENCFKNNFESVSCIYTHGKENDANLVLDKNDETSIQLNGLCDQSLMKNIQPRITDDNSVMQMVVKGTLQPLSISKCENTEPSSVIDDEDSSSLFAGVKQEMIILDHESSNVLEIIESNVKPVIESNMATENLEVEHCLTDISVPVNLSTNLCSLESSVNPAASGVSTEFGHILELDGKPSYLKLLPLRNGHSLWNMNDLRLAISQYGTVHLRLCAAPDSTDRNTNTSQCNFSALFLDDEVPPSDNDCGFQVTTMDDANKSKSVESRSCQTNFEQLLPIQGPILNKVSNSDYSYEFEAPENIRSTEIRRSCLPPPKSKLNYPVQAVRGKKRGRPPLHNKGKMVGSIGAFSRVMEGTNIPFHISKKGSSMDSIWKKYEKLQKSDPMVCKDGMGKNAEEDRELSLGYKKLLSLTCVQCGAIFRNKTTLLTHVKSNHRTFKKCRKCSERIHLQDKYSMRRHLLKTHKDRGQLLCSKCNVSFKVILHLKRHNSVIHESSESSDMSSCDISSDSDDDGQFNESESVINTTQKLEVLDKDQPVSMLEQVKPKNQTNTIIQSDDHIELNEAPDNEATKSSRQLRSTAGLNEAESFNADSEEGSDSHESGNESDVEDSNSSDNEEAKNYFCTKCDVGFSHKFKLKHHMAEHASNTYRNDKSESPDIKDEAYSDQFKEIIEPNDKLGNCLEEDESIDSPRRGNEIIKVSRVQFSRACTRSGKYFSDDTPTLIAKDNYLKRATNRTKLKEEGTMKITDSYEDHSSKVTKSDRPSYIIRRGRMFYCNKCNISFKREKIMTYHLKKIHETLYPFRACPDCEKIFRSCGPYNRHISQHKFTHCPVEGCKAKYRNIRLVKKHQKKNHSDYPHRCSRCIHLFKKKNQLSQHQNEAHAQKFQEDDISEEEAEEDVEEIEKMEDERETLTDEVSTILSGKRKRQEPDSYKEVDEEDCTSRRVYVSRKRKVQCIDVASAVSIISKKFKAAKLKAKLTNSFKKSKISSSKVSDASIKAEIKTKKCTTPKKNKLNTSWTAALKAKYQGNELTKKITVADSISKCSKPKNSHSSSPAITADVIRRVSDSLLSRKKNETVKKSKATKKAIRLDKSSLVKVRKDRSVKITNDTNSDHMPSAESSVVQPSQINEDIPANVLEFNLF